MIIVVPSSDRLTAWSSTLGPKSKELTKKASKGLFAFKHEVDLLIHWTFNPEAFQYFTESNMTLKKTPSKYLDLIFLMQYWKMESNIHLPNLVFFLTAMRPKTLGWMLAAKNCLSVITIPYECQNEIKPNFCNQNVYFIHTFSNLYRICKQDAKVPLNCEIFLKINIWIKSIYKFAEISLKSTRVSVLGCFILNYISIFWVIDESILRYQTFITILL